MTETRRRQPVFCRRPVGDYTIAAIKQAPAIGHIPGTPPSGTSKTTGLSSSLGPLLRTFSVPASDQQ
ncbi:hypothetical protein ACR786_16400 [Sphingobacterium multivorum]